jgi:hypothetical protein
MDSDKPALTGGVGDGARQFVNTARLVEPEAAFAAHVSEVYEYEAALRHAHASKSLDPS